MANRLLTIDVISYSALDILDNNLVLASMVNREFDGTFAQAGSKAGDTAQVRVPSSYVVTHGTDLVLQDHRDRKLPIKVDTPLHIGVAFGAIEQTLELDNYNERVLDPKISALANEVDLELSDKLALQTPYFVGTPGTEIGDSAPFLMAKAWLGANAVPLKMRSMVIPPFMEAATVAALEGLFNAASEISKQYTSGEMGMALGWKFTMDQNMSNFTAGETSGNPLVNGADQTEDDPDVIQILATNGWGAGSYLNVGDVIDIDSVLHINPKSRRTDGKRQSFVVDGEPGTRVEAVGGDMDIPIWPPIITDGAYQTVDAAPDDNAAIRVWGSAAHAHSGRTFSQGLGFHRDFGNLVSVTYEEPDGGVESFTASDDQVGLAIQLTKDHDINKKRNICRADLLIGANSLRRSFGVRVVGA